MGCYQEFQAWRIFWVLWTQLESRRRKSDTTDWQCIGWKKGPPKREEFFQDEIYWDEFRWYLHHNSQVSNYSASILDLLPHLGGKSQAAGLKDVNFTETAFWRTVRTGLLQAMDFHHSRKRGGHVVSGVWGGATLNGKKRGWKRENWGFNFQNLGLKMMEPSRAGIWLSWVYLILSFPPKSLFWWGVVPPHSCDNWVSSSLKTGREPTDPVKRCEKAI